MNPYRNTRLPAAIVALTTIAAALCVPIIPAALAATPIQRCEAADGTVIYTDKACAAHDAQHMPISGELLGRIARDEAATDAAASVGFDGALRPAKVVVARRSAASGCARNPTQLSMDLQGAWALGDVNRIAESYHWVGLDHRQGQQIMQRLDQLTGKPLAQAQYFDAQIGSGLMQLADASSNDHRSGSAGVMQLMFGEGGSTSVQDFEVERYRGCYFIRF